MRPACSIALAAAACLAGTRDAHALVWTQEQAAAPGAPAPTGLVVTARSEVKVYDAQGQFTGYDFNLEVFRLGLDGSFTPLVTGIPMEPQSLAVHEATGRWLAMMSSFHAGASFELVGRSHTVPLLDALFVLGDLTGPVAVTRGDRGCDNARKTCFEHALFFSPDAAYVFTESSTAGASIHSRWTFGRRPRQSVLTNRKTGWSLGVDQANHQACYQGRDGAMFLTPWPAQRRTARPLVAARTPLPSSMPRLRQPAAIRDGRIYFFDTEEPSEQRGTFGIYDLAQQRVIASHPATREFPESRSPLVPTASGSMLFIDDTEEDLGTLRELALDGTVRDLVPGVFEILGIADDGRHVVVSRSWNDKAYMGRSALIVVDLQSGTARDLPFPDPSWWVIGADFVR